MSMDDTTINSAATWAAVQEGRASWGEWVEMRLAERLGEERTFSSDVLAEVVGNLASDPRDELTKALTSLRAQRSLAVAGTYDPTVRYRALDVVALNGASFAARVDDPKQCPGDDWQLVATQGKKGPPGSPGEPGRHGRDAAAIKSWQIDHANFVVTPLMNDGTAGPPLYLRELFQHFLDETT
jgi:hypothetical protein